MSLLVVYCLVGICVRMLLSISSRASWSERSLGQDWIEKSVSSPVIAWRITAQFILTNHRTVYSDQSHENTKPGRPYKRRLPGPVKISLFLQADSWIWTRSLTVESTQWIIVINCWSAVVVLQTPYSIPQAVVCLMFNLQCNTKTLWALVFLMLKLTV